MLELPLDAVPKFTWHFYPETDRAVELWLRQYGYTYARLHRYLQSDDESYFWNATGFGLWHVDDTYCVLSGRSPNIPGCFHAVVGYIDHGGVIKVAHDPSPFKRGILGAPVYLSLLAAKHPHELKMPEHQRELALEYFN